MHYSQTKQLVPYHIYIITNKINGFRYVGLTTISTEERFKGHIRSSKKEDQRHKPLYAAMKDLSLDNFIVETVACCSTVSDLRTTERRIVRQENTRWPNGYNLLEGGGWKPRGNLFTPETIEILRQKAIAYAATPKGQRDKRNAFLGRTHTQETRDKVSAARRGIVFSDEHKYNLSVAQRLRFCNILQREQSGPRPRLTDTEALAALKRIQAGESLNAVSCSVGLSNAGLSKRLKRTFGNWRESIPDWGHERNSRQSRETALKRWARSKEK